MLRLAASLSLLFLFTSARAENLIATPAPASTATAPAITSTSTTPAVATPACTPGTAAAALPATAPPVSAGAASTTSSIPAAPAAVPAPAAGASANPATHPDDCQNAVVPYIYLVARIKLTDTDFTQVVFLRHSAITTMEACEAERNAGLTTGWNYFGLYYLKTFSGIPYKVDYRCVQSDQLITPWRNKAPYSHRYLVRTTDGQLSIAASHNFFNCRKSLRTGNAGESIEVFCATSSQTIVEDQKTDAADSDK
jgi:hypothetical protein